LNHYTVALSCCFALFWANLGIAVVGHRIGRRQLLAHPEKKQRGSGNIDAVILSLLGLLTAFTFSAAYSRYEARRQLIVDEANALGTAWLTGFGMAEFDKPAFTHLAGYSALASLVLVIICDIEYPGFGFVRLDVPHQLIIDLEAEIRTTL